MPESKAVSGGSNSRLYAYVCRYCGQPAPDEWGTSRRCPKHPDEPRRQHQLPPYMRECEFCPVPAVERDAAVETVKQLGEALAAARDDADATRTSAQLALDRSHNWLVANWRDESGSSIAGFIPEAEDA